LAAIMTGLAYLDPIIGLWLGAIGAALFSKRPIRFAAAVASILAVGAVFAVPHSTVHSERSFFGVSRIKEDREGYRILMHGHIVHGAQNPKAPREPQLYYNAQGPLGPFFDKARTLGLTGRVGVIGLGTGMIASYGRAGERWTFYEIDPAVERIARAYFSYLADSPAAPDVKIGDGRRSLAQEPNGSFGLIVIDAFSGDALPAHLMTREALQLYLSKVSERGWLLFNIASNYLELRPVLANLAADAGLQAALLDDTPLADRWRTRTRWVVLSRAAAGLGRPLGGDTSAVWTDDYSNVIRVFNFR
jgi:hypothetical protein